MGLQCYLSENNYGANQRQKSTSAIVALETFTVHNTVPPRLDMTTNTVEEPELLEVTPN